MIRSRSRWFASIVPFIVVTAAACGGGTPAETVRPKDPTAAGALGEKSSGTPGSADCREVESTGEPLVVDWKPEHRGDLEIVMKEGVAVASYSCKGLKILKDCKAEGAYGFLGMSKKEQVIRLSNADEVKANLPLAGAGIAANIGAEMQRGATLDVAMVMIGKIKTTNATVTRDDLKGDECKDATHFVKGAIVGAFVMETGTKGDVKTAAQFFGAGASGASSSSKNVQNKDGDIADCAKADPDSKKAPPQCRAMVRLELKAIAPSAKGEAAAKPAGTPPEKPAPAETAAAKAPEPAAVEVGCPKGMVMTDGKCAVPSKEVAHQCKPTDKNECNDQCAKGNAASCTAAGVLASRSSKDQPEGRKLLQKGCDGGDARGCSNLGLMLVNGYGGPRDLPAAVKLWEKSCADADPLGCNMLGEAYNRGEGVTKDEAKAVTLWTKACEGGDDGACGRAGKYTLDGKGTTKDVAKAADYLKRACLGNIGWACGELGLMQETGNGLPKNAMIAKDFYFRGCIRGAHEACTNQGRLELGQGGNQDAAKRAFESACNFHSDAVACAAMKVLYGSTRPFIPPVREAQDAQRACSSGSARDCATAAAFNMANNQKAFGVPQAERACMGGDPFGCALKSKK